MAEQLQDAAAQVQRKVAIVTACIWLEAQQGSELTGKVVDEQDFGGKWP